MKVKYATEIENEMDSPQTEPYDSMLIIGDLICTGKSFLYKTIFNGCTIKGNIKFSNCSFKDELSFIDTYFEGNISFNNVIFEKSSRFNGCQFGSFSLAYLNKTEKSFEIKQSCFRGEVNFSSNFYLKANFNQVVFEKIASFHGVNFLLYVSFIKCIFMDSADFMFSEFEGNTLFYKAKFLDEVDFEEAKFGRNMGFEYLLISGNSVSGNRRIKKFDFKKSIFNGETSFWKAKFYGNSMFENTTFFETCNFLGAMFVGNVGFHGAEFKSFAKFGAGSKIFGNADFSEVVFHEGAYFHNLVFGKKLKLARAKIENLMIRWDSIRDHLEGNWQLNEDIIRLEEVFDKSIIPLYLSLIRNFNNLGFPDDADQCYLELRKKKKKNIEDIKSKIMDDLDCALFGYGVHWGNPLACGLGIIIFFLLIFFVLDNNFRTNNIAALINATSNSVSSFISSPNSDNNLITILSYIERFLGYIIMSCFLVTLAKKRLR